MSITDFEMMEGSGWRVDKGKTCHVYERQALRRVTGELVRPGDMSLTERAFSFCNLPPGAKVLDVGCGTGATTEYLIKNLELRAVGIDPSSLLLAQGLARNPELPLLQAEGGALPFSDSEMDGILAECSFSVMADTEQVLAEFFRVLKNDGYLILTDVYARNPAGVAALNSLPLVSCLSGALSREELTHKLQTGGFSVALWEDHSNVLKELAAKLIFAHGSLSEFWRQAAGGSETEAVDAPKIMEAVAKAKPGYYLLVARKKNILCVTESVCPECLARIPACRVLQGNDVFLEKCCPVHGYFRTPVWRGNPSIDSWVNRKSPSHPTAYYTESQKGCPFDCGLCLEHRQHTCTALIEVTERCNLSCRVCFADAGRRSADDSAMDVIEGWYRSVLKVSGTCNIQLSGGEPTMRDDLPDLVRLGRRMGFEFIQVNTNGLRLANDEDYVRELAKAGLSSIFFAV